MCSSWRSTEWSWGSLQKSIEIISLKISWIKLKDQVISIASICTTLKILRKIIKTIIRHNINCSQVKNERGIDLKYGKNYLRISKTNKWLQIEASIWRRWLGKIKIWVSRSDWAASPSSSVLQERSVR